MPLTKINTHVYRFNNQFFYGEKVGTYLINLHDKVILFDLPTYSEEIESYFRSLNKPLMATLSHGPCGINDGKIWQKNFKLQVYLHKLDINNEWLELKPDHTFTISPDIDKSIAIIHTPGHTPGSVCLLHKDSGSLFTGDAFAGNSDGSVRNFLKNPDASGDLQLRLKSCKKLMKLDFDKALPFHYEMILNNAKDNLGSFVKLNEKHLQSSAAPSLFPTHA